MKTAGTMLLYLQCLTPLAMAQVAPPAPPAPTIWAVDPNRPGPDLPPAGVSLFDRLTIGHEGSTRTLPFPFARMVQHIERAAGCDTRSPCTRAVLIPLGRSLQRLSAAPDFFAHPRVVVAVVADGTGPLMLRDRLYLGYQERAGLIEVISYNERLGRFEFQLVKNYRAGAKPEVVYARRDICVSCHQNQAPIFSRQQWDETNANPAVAARLAAADAATHGVAVRSTTEVANAIDTSTERANRLSLTRLLWQGCGDNGRCRAAALQAALQFRLSGDRGYDSAGAFETELTNTLAGSARARWPAGIAVANPDLPNRDPLQGAFAQRAAELAGVPARLEPLAPRPPQEVLPADGATLAHQLVRGLSELWPARDVRELDRALIRHADRLQADRRVIEAPCTWQEDNSMDCVSPEGDGRVALRSSADAAAGVIGSLTVGSMPAMRHLSVPARLPDGNRVERIVVKRDAVSRAGSMQLQLREDFAAAGGQLRQWAAEQSNDVLPASASLRALVARIGGAAPACCEDSTGPVRPAEADAARPAVHAAAAFEPHCGACHRTAESTPPNFLQGDAERVTAALSACAPRMFVRLSMWQLPRDARDKTPMPPERVSAAGHGTASSIDSAALAALIAGVRERLAGNGQPQTLGELMQGGYENLPACLPVQPGSGGER